MPLAIHIRKDRNCWWLLAAFALVHVFLFYKTGVFTGMEAEKYIREGTELANGNGLTEKRFIFYLPVIICVAVCRLLSLPLYTVVVVQILLAAMALYCFYRVAVHLAGKQWGFIAALLLALCLPLQQWNLYLYSDAFFIQFSIIFFSALYYFSVKNRLPVFAITGMALLWCLSRPAGILFLLPLFVYVVSLRFKAPVYWLGSLLVIALMLFAARSYFGGGGDLDTLKPYIEEHIVCFVPEKPEGAAIDIVQTGQPMNDLFYYIAHNPAHFGKLLLKKLGSFFNLYRPWYTTTYNVLLIMLMLVIYPFFLLGFRTFVNRNRSFAFFVVAVLFVYPVGVALQCDDWHSRFTMPLLPLLIWGAVLGMRKVTGRMVTG